MELSTHAIKILQFISDNELIYQQSLYEKIGATDTEIAYLLSSGLIIRPDRFNRFVVTLSGQAALESAARQQATDKSEKRKGVGVWVRWAIDAILAVSIFLAGYILGRIQ